MDPAIASSDRSRPFRRCVFCRSLLCEARERCDKCGRYIDVLRNPSADIASYVSGRVHDWIKEGRAEGSVRDSLVEKGFPSELFEERLNALAAARRRSIRAWGIGQAVIGGAILLAGLVLSVGSYMAIGRTFIITIGIILAGAATLGRGLQACSSGTE